MSCHGATHAFLSYTPDEYIRREIRENKMFLEEHCGYPVRGMSYPFSSFDQRVIEACQGEGMEYARTAESTMRFDIPKDFMRLFYAWGHSYELQTEEQWQRMEEKQLH